MTLTQSRNSRNSNLELYRIIVMILIVAHHYVVNSGLKPIIQTDPLSAQSIFLYLFGAWGKTGINCFVLITGYFMCQSSITVRKFLKLILEIYFYKFLIFFIFILLGYESLNFKTLILKLLPTTSIAQNFTGCFIIFYLCIPFLNKLIQNIDQRMHRNLVILALTTYTLFSLIPSFNISLNYVSWFCVLYIISSYIRFYGLLPSFKTKHWGYCTLVSITLSVVSILAMLNLFPGHWPYKFVSDSNSLFAVTTGISSFMFFKSLNIKHSALINAIGGSTFGVLLIHANSNAMRSWLWYDTLNNAGSYGSDSLYIHAFASVLIVFTVCIILDRLRILFIEKPTFVYVDKMLAKYRLK